MARRSLPCVQDGHTYVILNNDTRTNSKFPYPSLVVLVLFTAHLLSGCDSIESTATDVNENTTVTLYMSAVTQEMEHLTSGDDTGQEEETLNLDAPGKLVDSGTDKTGEDLTHKEKLHHNITYNKDDSRSNDVLHKLGLDVTATEKTTQTQSLENLSTTFTTEKPKPYTRRDIYIRGHLLKHPPPGRKTFHPPETEEGLFRSPNSVHLNRVQNFRDDGDEETGNRKKRKHNAKKERFYNYKLLYDTIKGGSDPNQKRTEFYAWIFGAAMLGLGSLTTVTSCFVFCFCGDRVRKKRVARARRPHDKAGEYQRVESVSSIVDHGPGGEPLDTIYEEQIDSVTII